MNAPALALTPPRIGQPWPEAGGIYCGIAPSPDHGADDHLIMAEEAMPDRSAWQAALDWGTALRIGGFDDWHVGTRDEYALAYAHVRHLVDTGPWYWTSTQYSRDGAWHQYFDYGSQLINGKKYEAAARAFRRFKVQSFNPSILSGEAMAEHAAQLRRMAYAMTTAADQIDCAHARRLAEARDEAESLGVSA